MFPRSTLRRSHHRAVRPRFPRPLLFSQSALDWVAERTTREADLFDRRRARKPASDPATQEPTPHAGSQVANNVRAAADRFASHRLVSAHRSWLLRVVAPTAVLVACFAIALQFGNLAYASVIGAATAVVLAVAVIVSMLF